MHTHTHAHPHAHAHHSHTPPLRAHRPSMRPRPCLPPVSHGGAPPSCSARRGPHPFPSAFGAAGRRRCGRPPARLSAAARGLARGLPAHGLHLSRVCARDAPPLVHYGAGRDHHRPPRRAIAPASPSADPPPKSHRFLCSPQGPSRTSSRCSRRAAGARAAAVASPRWTRAPGRSAPPTRSGCSWCAHMFVLRAVWGGAGAGGRGVVLLSPPCLSQCPPGSGSCSAAHRHLDISAWHFFVYFFKKEEPISEPISSRNTYGGCGG